MTRPSHQGGPEHVFADHSHIPHYTGDPELAFADSHIPPTSGDPERDFAVPSHIPTVNDPDNRDTFYQPVAPNACYTDARRFPQRPAHLFSHGHRLTYDW